MSEEPPVSKLKLLIVGHEKNGKSRLAATGRKPILFHDFDNRAEALNGIAGVYVIPYPDPQWPMQPEAAQDFLDILGQLESNLDISKLTLKGKKVFPDSVKEGTILKTNVIDSVVTYGADVQRYAMYGSKDLRREITFSGHKVFLPAGWDAWNSEMKEVENNFLRLLALPTDTIGILHEYPEETPDSTPEAKKFTGRVAVYPARYELLLKYFNEVWRVRLTQKVTQAGALYLPKVYPLPTWEFDCATAMLLDPQEEPNIEAMILKHEARLKNGYQLGAGEQKALPATIKI